MYSNSLDYAEDEIPNVCPACLDPGADMPHLPPCDRAWSEPNRTWTCHCGATVEHYRGQDDVECGRCGQWFNAFGQALRDDWAANPSTRDEDISDLEGYEIAHAGD